MTCVLCGLGGVLSLVVSCLLAFLNADPAAPSWREYESKPLTREMYDRFYGIK